MMKYAAIMALALHAHAEVDIRGWAETGEKRQLQQVAYGSQDLDICSTDQSTIRQAVGTIHDDDTNSNVDCSINVCSCGSGVDQTDTCHIGYGDNLNCGKHIQAPNGQAVHLLFTQLNLEGGFDSVNVYDGANANSPLLGSYSGSEVPGRIISTGRDMYITFVTDHGNAGIIAPGDPGFYADWYFALHLDDEGICNAGYGTGTVENLNSDQQITDAHGTLHDDQGHQNVDCSASPATCGSTDNSGYGDNLNCYIALHAPEGQTVRLTFTQLNLEGPGTRPGCQPCTDPRGCDWVEVFDGPDQNSPSLGTFSGTPQPLPTVVTTQQTMFIQFLTDYHNCGISGTEDPGFFADWDFVEAGENVCEPSAAVLRSDTGVLHDDDVYDEEIGYGDHLDCGVRIHAGQGQTINLKMDHMNLEGGNTFSNGGQTCDDFGPDNAVGTACDYLIIYDGNNADAPEIARWTGNIVDSVAGGDAITSSGRNLFVRFVTDGGNGGIAPGVGQFEGFWAEWQFIDNGAQCDHDFSVQVNTGLVGHNQEFLNLPLAECQAACCARDWCKSIDFGRPSTPGDAGTCILADMDATTQMGATASNNFYDLYERNHFSTSAAAEGPAGCATSMAQLVDSANAACCPDEGCSGMVPAYCAEECADIWVPFAKHCSQYLVQSAADNNLGGGDIFQPLIQLTHMCEETEYGHYQGGSRGRCADDDYQYYVDDLLEACCRYDFAYCPNNAAVAAAWNGQGDGPAFTLEVPTLNGAPVCTDECRATAEDWYAECNPRFDAPGFPGKANIEQFLSVCQGMPAVTPGGGH